MISLADTVGMASAEQIQELVSTVLGKFDYLEIGVHLHSRPDQAAAKVLAAYEAGCRRFESALGGLGGCPFAQDALVGNIATETVIETLKIARGSVPCPAARWTGCCELLLKSGRATRSHMPQTEFMSYKTIQLDEVAGVCHNHA